MPGAEPQAHVRVQIRIRRERGRGADLRPRHVDMHEGFRLSVERRVR